MTLDGLPLQISLECPQCHQPLHVQGMTEAALCKSCQAELQLTPEIWLGWFGPEEIVEALELPEGEGRTVTTMGGTSAKYAYGHRMPRCQACKSDVPPDELEALAAAGGWVCSCGERMSVRVANDLAKVVVPGARYLVNEGAVGTDTAEPKAATEPVLFSCMGCGGSLKIDGSERTVTCTYCSASNFLPDGLWLRMHPPQTVQTFFVVLELGGDAGEVPLELLERLAASDDCDAREAVAANHQAPQALVESLAGDDDDDVREAVALNPVTSVEVLCTLAKDHDWEVRRAAVRSGRLPQDVLAAVAASETDSDVMEELGRQTLGPQVLRALGTSDKWRNRQAAASNPDTPDDILVALASDSDSDVLEALLARPELPGAAVLTLASHDSSSIAEKAQRRPEYQVVAAAQWKKKLILVGVGGVVVLGILAVAGIGAVGFAVVSAVLQML